MNHRALLAAILAALVLAPAEALAQSIDPTTATELFKQGREAMNAGDHERACPKFAESLRLDAKVGTALNLAECEERIGHLADARARLQRAVDLARAEHDDRLAFAKERLDAIDKRVPRLTVKLSAAAPPGTTVERDDVPLGAGSLGAAIPVNPGAHAVLATAPGYEPNRSIVNLAEGRSITLEVAPGAKLASAAPASTPPASPSLPSAAPQSLPASSSDLRAWGFVAGGAGVLAAGVGTVFGLMAISKNHDSQKTCDSTSVCDPPGYDARNTARTYGDVSTVAFVVGGVALATGAVLVLSAPSDRSPKAARVEALPALGGGAIRATW